MLDHTPPPGTTNKWVRLAVRARAHPEVAAAVFAFTTGLAVVISTLAGPEWALISAPPTLSILAGSVLTVGAALVVLGILHPRLQNLEQHGWPLVTVAAIVFAGTFAMTRPYGLGWWLALQWAAVGALRILELWEIRLVVSTLVGTSHKDVL